MGFPKLYETSTEKKAAKKANYDRYYKRHQEAINARRRSRYAQARSTASKTATPQSSPRKKCHQTVSNAQTTVSAPPRYLKKRLAVKRSPTPESTQDITLATTFPSTAPTAPTLAPKSSGKKEVLCAIPTARRRAVTHQHSSSTSTPEQPATSVSLRLAKQSVEALFDSYVAGLGGSWPRFFERLSTSFIASGDSKEIDEAFDNYKRAVKVMEKRYILLQDAAVMAGDYVAMEEGHGMLERMKEVGSKLREFYCATLHGSKDFEEQVDAGDLTW